MKKKPVIPPKKTREKSDKDNPFILAHYQIRPDQDKALKNKAIEEGVAVQKLIRDLIDENIMNEANLIRV